MFTGLIEGTGCVESLKTGEGGWIRLASLPWTAAAVPGESIAVNGVCLTVTASEEGWFTADLSPETLSRSNLIDLKTGDLVNLERPLRLGDRLGGHLVLGHVDGVGILVESVAEGAFWRMEYEVQPQLMRYIVEKGSIAVDGISLTIAGLEDNRFEVAVIPSTREMTNLRTCKIGHRANIETDIIAKHVEALLHPYHERAKITQDFLNEHGFI